MAHHESIPIQFKLNVSNSILNTMAHHESIPIQFNFKYTKHTKLEHSRYMGREHVWLEMNGRVIKYKKGI